MAFFRANPLYWIALKLLQYSKIWNMQRGWQIMHTNLLQNHFRTCLHWIILALGWCPVSVSTVVLVSLYKPANMKRAVEDFPIKCGTTNTPKPDAEMYHDQKRIQCLSTNVCCPFKVSIPNWGYLWPELYCNIWVHQI